MFVYYATTIVFVPILPLQCGRYILYYHNAKRTVRLFKRDGENKQVANYCLHTEATAFITSEDGNR